MISTSIIFRIAIFAFTWVILAKGVIDSWIIGIPAIVIAVCVAETLRQSRPHRLSLLGLSDYVVFFLKYSIYGGIDVIRRAYHPRMPLNPAEIDYHLSLKNPSARLLFACTVSLLPGTLCVDLGDEDLTIHVLDVQRPYDQELKAIEKRVAAIFRFDNPI